RKMRKVPDYNVLVRSRGLEPPRLAALTPQASASTNSATTAAAKAPVGPAPVSKPEAPEQAVHIPPLPNGQDSLCQWAERPFAGANRPQRPAGTQDPHQPRPERDPCQMPTGLPRAAIEWMAAPAPVPYEVACAVMAARVEAIAAGTAPEAVWLLEHPPLYTAGTSAKREHLLQPARLPVFTSPRGGQFTYHGPGQRVAYLMLDVGARFGDVRAYVAAIEQWIIAVLAELGVAAERREGLIGVWVNTSISPP